MMDMEAAVSEQQKKAFRKSSSVKPIKEAETAIWGLNNPADYKTIYAEIKPMSVGGGLGAAFGNGPAAHNSPLISRRAQEIQPGMYSFDGPVLKYQRWLSDQLNSRFDIDVDDDGFSKTGIHTNFDRLRCPAGYFQNPMSYTTVDNTEYRKELGLSQGYTPRQKAIALEFWTLVFSEAQAAPVNVSKLSTGGMRRFSSSAQWKLDYANWVTQPAEFERMLDCVGRGDWLELANRYEQLFATYIQKRGQVDDPSKKRTVFDLEYALSGGLKGKSFHTDKTVVINGVVYSDFSAIRARVVHAGPWTVNCYLQIIATCTMQSMFKRFPKTFHINTGDQIKSVVDGKHVYCSDVTEYDRSMSREAIEVVHEAMGKFWDERMVKASWRLFTSPYYAKPLDMNGKRGTWVLDPTDWSQELFAGNRSGHGLTSLVAKGNKVIETLFVIDRQYPVLGRVEKYLNHETSMVLVNNGDDEITAADQGADMATFKVNRADLGSGHYVVKPEVGQGFSGQLLLKTDVPLVYKPTARVHTSLEKWLIPERSIGGIHRPYWPIGLMDRVRNLTSTDIGREIWSVAMHGYREMLQPYYGDFNEMLTGAVARMDVRMDGLSDIDRDVLANNDRIHHKYLPEEVSDEALSKISSKIPVERIYTILKMTYRGLIK